MKKPAARKRKQAAVKPRVADPAPPAALAAVIDLAQEDDINLAKPFSEKAIDRLTKLAPEPAVAVLARTINKVSRRQAFELSRIRRAIADLGLELSGPGVPFRQGMQTMINALPDLYKIAQVRMKDHPQRSHLEALLDEAKQHKDAADKEFRRQRQLDRLGPLSEKAGGDQQATMRAAKRRETKSKPKA